MLNGMLQAAHALVTALGITDKHEPGKIHVMDAWRYVVKTMREMRMAIAVGGSVDIDKLVTGDPQKEGSGVAVHIGISDASGIAAIKAAFAAERDAFVAHVADAKKKLGEEHAHFHEDHGILDGRNLPKKRNRHTGKDTADPEMPASAELGHETYEKVKSGAKVG